MKIINSSVKIINQDPGLQGILEMIEKAGRTCYKSVGTRYFKVIEEESKLDNYKEFIEKLSSDTRVLVKTGAFFDNTYYVSIPNRFINDYPELVSFTEEEKEQSPYYVNLTAKDFVEMIIKNGHGAMLEHGTVYLYAPSESYINFVGDLDTFNPLEKYFHNSFSDVSENVENDIESYYVTTNMRVLVENDWLDDLKYLCEPTEYHEKRITAKFICDRGVSHELVRHRVFSFAQESTRFCNYNTNKFNNEITYILPSWCPYEEGDYGTIDNPKRKNAANGDGVFYEFVKSLQESEYRYFSLLRDGWKPQQARAVLPNALKTELIMTGFKSAWEHFFDLRCAPSAHPDMIVLASSLKKQMYD